MFKFNNKPSDSINNIWGASFKLYLSSISKVWYLVSVLGIIMSSLAFITRYINNYLNTQNRYVALVVVSFFVLSFFSYLIGVILHRMYFIGKAESVPLSNSFDFVWQKYAAILISSILVTASSLFGAFILILPGIFIGILLMFVMPLILFDNKGILSSIVGSTKLVWGSWWRSFFVFAPFVLLFFASNLTIHSLFADKIIVIGVLNTIVYVLLYPFFYSLLLVLFNDLKIR